MLTKNKLLIITIVMMILILITVFCRNTEKFEADKFPSVPKQCSKAVAWKCFTEKVLEQFFEITRKKPSTKTSLWWVFSRRFSILFQKTCFLEHLREVASVSDYCLRKIKHFSNRSSQRMCSVKKGVVKNFAIFIGKHLYWNLLLIKLQAFRPQILEK